MHAQPTLNLNKVYEVTVRVKHRDKNRVIL